jgi:hypothetical protein
VLPTFVAVRAENMADRFVMKSDDIVRGEQQRARGTVGIMSSRDQLAIAALFGQAERCVHQSVPVDEAVASLQEITERPDLLARAAGILAGSADPETGERPWRIAAARLLVRAGADRASLPQWIRQGRSNASRPSGWGAAREWPDDLDQILTQVLAGTGN